MCKIFTDFIPKDTFVTQFYKINIYIYMYTYAKFWGLNPTQLWAFSFSSWNRLMLAVLAETCRWHYDRQINPQVPSAQQRLRSNPCRQTQQRKGRKHALSGINTVDYSPRLCSRLILPHRPTWIFSFSLAFQIASQQWWCRDLFICAGTHAFYV
jgi:hypothetical protein